MRPKVLAMLSVCAVVAAFAGCGRSGPMLVGDDDDDDDDDGNTITLSVTVTSGGHILSQPPGIDCGSDCSEAFALGQQVQLTAFEDSGSFHSWGGACVDETDITCLLLLTSSASASARFLLPGDVVWARRVGGNGDDDLSAVAIATNGDLFATGGFVAPADFTSLLAHQAAASTLAGYGGEDIPVARFSAESGELLWAKAWGGTADDRGNGIATDGNGRLFFGGEFEGTIDLGGPDLTSNGADGFITCHRARDGAFQWQDQLGAANDDRVNAVAAYNDRATSGGIVSDTAAIAEEWTAAAMAFDGSLDFSGGESRVNGMAASGPNLFLVGRKTGPAQAEGVAIGTIGGEDAFVVRGVPITGGSTVAFRLPLGGAGDDEGNAIATFAGGDAVVTGMFVGSATFGATNLTAQGEDAFVARIAANGSAIVWAMKIGQSGDDVGTAIAVGPDGDVYVAGATAGANDDVFVARLAGATGNVVWIREFGGTGNDEALGIAVTSGGVFVAGSFQASATFGDFTLTGPAREGFLIRLHP